MPYSQEERLISLTTPLGTDVLLLAGFTGHEAISRLFSFHLDLLTEQSPIDFTQIIGQNVTISVKQKDNTFRYFNGLVSRFVQSGKDVTFTHYQMEVVPWTWMLTRFANCKIFHNKSVTDIIQQIFSDRGFTDFKLNVSSTYSPLEYCVQYRETDFNFISRLMEQNGIFYFFQHEEGKHTMVLADASSAHEACPGQNSAGYNLAIGGLDDDDVINTWSIGQVLRSGKYSLTDYNFITPSTSLLASEPTIVSVGGNSSFELFDYPGEYGARADGTAFAKLRMQEEEAVHMIAHGGGVCRAFTTGYKFDLTDHYQDSMNTTYVLTEIQHVASVGGSYVGGSGTDSYSNNFVCIPAATPFRPLRLTPKPFVQGPQTAVVVGKSQLQSTAGIEDDGSDTEDIWVDKYGRVVVLFPWDRDSDCSCRVRVSQEWAGQGWGSITIPRVGQEVIVSFLEGDPDRPIITGRVYNANNMPPYTLPDYQTRSTLMTRSSTGGSASTYNELRFEDKTGKEQVFLRAQFDQDNYVTNDSREWIGNNRSLLVTKDQMEKISGDRHEQVVGKHIEKVTGDWNSNVTGNINQKAAQNISVQAGMNLYEKSGQNFAHEAGMAIHLKAGMNVVIEAGVELTLKAGGSFIDIGPAGIAISGAPMVMINSGGSAGSGPGSSPTDPASPTDPDLADDGKSGTKRGGGGSSSSSSGSSAASSSSSSSSASSSSHSSSPSSSPALSPSPASNAAAAGAAGAASGAGGQANQAAQQAAQQAAGAAQQAADQAQQSAGQAEQAAQQTQKEAQQAVQQVTDQARQAFNQANQSVKQAQQSVDQATAQGKAAAQQALDQAQQQATQSAQQAFQAVSQAKAQAEKVEQQAQQQAQQAQQAAQQAQQAAKQAQQQAQQAAQQGQQTAQQAQQQAQQAQQQAQQAAQQAQQAAKQAQQQAQQASQQVQQSAQQATQQAQQSAQQAQQSAQQAVNQAQRGF
jgi:type VI secretion system secreted protein VgrG